MNTRAALTSAALLAGVVLSGCGGSDESAATTTVAASTTTTLVLTSDGLLRVRPVITLLPIDGIPMNPFGDDDPAAPIVSPNVDSSVAYDLGPSVAEETDVVGAVATENAGEWKVTVTLSDDATQDMRKLARTCAATKPACERGQIAVTVDGFVLAAIPVVDDSIGPDLVLSASLNELQANAIADAVHPTG